MQVLLVLIVVGFLAQLIDGALGMAYGATSTTLLLTAGLAPATASASVHLAELATTAASGVSHWRFGNLDWRTVRRLAIPGAVGAFVGAIVLSSISSSIARPWMACILILLGVYILVRFTLGLAQKRHARPYFRLRYLYPLGAGAGFIDATGGGGWGPATTPALLATGKMEPRKVVGSVDTSEFLVALAATAGFLIGLGHQVIASKYVLALAIGGLFAAPLAAWLVRKVTPRILGVSVGGLILLTNARTLFDAIGIAASTRLVVYLAVTTAWLLSVAFVVRHHRQTGTPLFNTTTRQQAETEQARAS